MRRELLPPACLDPEEIRFMPTFPRLGLTMSVLLAACATELHAQQPIPTDQPGEFAPVRPETRADLDRREARKLYALGVLRQRQDRLLDALRSLEDAAQL